MTLHNSLVATRQIPDHVKDNYDLFVVFVKTYYKFLDEQHYQDLRTTHEIDEANTLFLRLINNFKFEFARYFPITLIEKNKSLIMRHLRDFYLSRGSENSFKFLFNVLFNDTAELSAPSVRMLRPSQARWNQEHFITANITVGSLPTNISGFYILYESAVEFIPITRTINVGGSTIRLYYSTSYSVLIRENSTLKIVDDVSDTECLLRVIKSPNHIEVESGGLNWQLGQLITIKHNSDDTVGEDTLVRVSSIGEGGVLKRLEIINHGYNHVEDGSFILSPYPNKPLSSGVNFESRVNTDKVSFTYTLTLTDIISSITESFTGYLSTDLTYKNLGSYVTNIGMYYKYEDPAQSSDGVKGVYAKPADHYNCSIPFKQVIVGPALEEDNNDYGITIEQWIASSARVKYKYGVESRTKGFWSDDDGKLSNSWIRIQDDYYYQQFSYVVGSSINPKRYVDLIGTVHTAGTIQFREYSSTNVQKLSSDFTVSSSILELDGRTNSPYGVDALILAIETKTKNEEFVWPARIPSGAAAINCTIIWGDGAKTVVSGETSTTSSKWKHVYVLPGQYEVAIFGSIGGPQPSTIISRDFLANVYPKFQGKIKEIKQWGTLRSGSTDLLATSDWASAFVGCDNPLLRKPISSSASDYIEAADRIYDRTIYATNNFTMTIRTTTNNETFVFPYRTPTEPKNDQTACIIWWGDGTMSHVTSYYGGSPVSAWRHTYARAGDYKIMLAGVVEAPMFYNSAHASKLVSVDNWGSSLSIANSWSNAFRGCGTADNPIVIKAADSFGFDVTDLSGMFENCYFTVDSGATQLNAWDVHMVKNMSRMFKDTTFNGDISNWNTTSLENTSSMFENNTAFNRALNTSGNYWNLSKVTDMSYMFAGASSFNGDITNWIPQSSGSVASSVTNMQGMFKNAVKFNQPIGNWDVSKVTDMSWLFAGASDFNQSIATWDTTNVIDMDHMFYSAP